MQTEQLIYRVPDVARLLGCSEAAARRMIERGDIPSRRLGRRVVVMPEELEAHLRSLRRATETIKDSAGQAKRRKGGSS